MPMYDVNAYEMMLKSAGAGQPLVKPMAELSYTQMLEQTKYKQDLIKRADEEMIKKKEDIQALTIKAAEMARNPENPATPDEIDQFLKAGFATLNISTDTFNRIYPSISEFLKGIHRTAGEGVKAMAESYLPGWQRGAAAYQKGEAGEARTQWQAERYEPKRTFEQEKELARITAASAGARAADTYLDYWDKGMKYVAMMKAKATLNMWDYVRLPDEEKRMYKPAGKDKEGNLIFKISEAGQAQMQKGINDLIREARTKGFDLSGLLEETETNPYMK